MRGSARFLPEAAQICLASLAAARAMSQDNADSPRRRKRSSLASLSTRPATARTRGPPRLAEHTNHRGRKAAAEGGRLCCHGQGFRGIHHGEKAPRQQEIQLGDFIANNDRRQEPPTHNKNENNNRVQTSHAAGLEGVPSATVTTTPTTTTTTTTAKMNPDGRGPKVRSPSTSAVARAKSQSGQGEAAPTHARPMAASPIAAAPSVDLPISRSLFFYPCFGEGNCEVCGSSTVT